MNYSKNRSRALKATVLTALLNYASLPNPINEIEPPPPPLLIY